MAATEQAIREAAGKHVLGNSMLSIIRPGALPAGMQRVVT